MHCTMHCVMEQFTLCYGIVYIVLWNSSHRTMEQFTSYYGIVGIMLWNSWHYVMEQLALNTWEKLADEMDMKLYL